MSLFTKIDASLSSFDPEKSSGKCFGKKSIQKNHIVTVKHFGNIKISCKTHPSIENLGKYWAK